jgi:acetyltransferase-like isoleucine patch superfamily enzyme
VKPRHVLTSFFREARTATAVDARRVAIGAFARALPEFAFPGIRAQLLRAEGAHIARGVAVLGRVDIVGPHGAAQRLHIGEGTLIGPNVTFCLDERITIGCGVSIGPKVMLYTATHALGPETRRMSRVVAAHPIVVEDGAWVGLAAIVLPGVCLGRGCVVSAGAVVTKNVPPNTLVAGNPAIVVQELPFARGTT